MPHPLKETAKKETKPVQIDAARHRTLKQLAAIRGCSMAEILEAQIDAMADAHGIATVEAVAS